MSFYSLFSKTIFTLAFLVAAMQGVSAQPETAISYQALQSVAAVLVGDGEGSVTKVSAAVSLTGEGVFLVPYHVVKDAKEVQVRLKSGEIFDTVWLRGTDDRRDVAAIRIINADLRISPPANAEELKPGDSLYLVSVSPGKMWSVSPAKFLAVRLADEVPGAGEGFRGIHFEGQIGPDADGGILFTSAGLPLGVVTSGVGFAVPVASGASLVLSDPTRSFLSGRALKLPASYEAFMAARNAGTDPKALFLASKTVHVETNTTFFKEAQLVNELNKRKEVKDWGWVLTTGSWDARNKADMIIELDHPILTFDFTFTVRHRKSSILISAGKVVITGGSSGAGKMTDKIIKSINDLLNPPTPKK